MDALAYLLPSPSFDLTPGMRAAFEHLYGAAPRGGLVDYHLPYPKWQYLSYLCESRELVLHGSQDRDIVEIEPRQANDKRVFSSQRAIYATTDGIWAIFFAILDRTKHPAMSLFNSCLRARDADGRLSDPLYFFSVSHWALLQRPWCEGAVYIMPRQTFEQEAPQQVEGTEIVFPHWIGESPTRPSARLCVGPDDFPFLAQIHGHNDERLVRLATDDPGGFPWPEALES